MIELWVVVALVAGAVQTLRFALQKSLGATGLSPGGATFSRFLFGAPIALLAALTLIASTDTALPPLPPRFWAFACAGGLAQIVATMATVALFSARNFAVGIAFTKSETLLVALFSLVLLGEAISPSGLAAILVGVAGVLLLSWKTGGGRLALVNRASGLGLAAGALFGLAAIGYRGATLQVAADSALLRALVTLAAATTFQTLAMLAYLRIAEPGEITRVLARWRTTGLVGVTGIAGSMGWFFAFALQNAAYVRALGQVELVYSLLLSWVVFRDRITSRELVGMALLVVSIVALILVV
ncbi:DMT family transporter [Maritimibacter dapengensis]|uniref:DMT family transporter n=1 Tax=Maritimibacter dapengensis TaxID=2836868 RepID=A0ABS6T0K8_9RHOB|nr:DMT family transporter [Maritimibacter dapengensis]MBV7378769.1 DMT family transporter [Maritimibacter dapengensis]